MYRVKSISTLTDEPVFENSVRIDSLLFTLLPDSGILNVRAIPEGRLVKKSQSHELFNIKSTVPSTFRRGVDDYSRISFNRINIAMVQSTSNVHACIWSSEIFVLFGGYLIFDEEEKESSLTRSKIRTNISLGIDYGARNAVEYLTNLSIIPRKFHNLARML